MKKKITSFLLMVSLLLTCCSIPAAAGTASPTPKAITLFRYTSGAKAGTYETGHIFTNRFYEGSKNVKAVSSNKKIATVKVLRDEFEGEYYFRVTPKKKGSATITMTATVDGKKVVEKTKVKIVNYQNPAASFKINSKDYAKKFKNHDESSAVGELVRNKKLKVSCKPAKGWTVKYIRKFYNLKMGDDMATCAYFPQKNNTTITFGSDAITGEIQAAFYNKTLNKTVRLAVNLK